jgi:hypothetical protein
VVKQRGPPSQGWRTFLRNHAPDIAAMDGSAKKALEVEPPFQRLVFIEPHKKRHAALAALKAANPHRDIVCFRDESAGN